MIYKVKTIMYACGYGEESYETPDYEEEYEFNTEEEAEYFIETEIDSSIKEYMKYWDNYNVDNDDEFGFVSLSFAKYGVSSLETVTKTWYKLWL